MKAKSIAFLSIGMIIIVSINMAAVINVPLNYSKIQWAINAASIGDTILVSAGTYYENINYHGKSIVVKAGDSPDLVVINGSQPSSSDSGSVVIFISGEVSSSILDGFTITGGTGTITDIGKRGGGIFCANAKPTIKNCTIKGNQSECGGGIGFWHNSSYQYKDSTLVKNCTVVNNTATNDYGGGIWVGYSTVLINSCTIVGNTATNGSNLSFSSFGSGSHIISTIIWFGSIYTMGENYNYCDIQGGWPSGTGNINADPLFCNSIVGDYHIAANSPCLGTGQGGTTIGALSQGCGVIVDVENQLVLPTQYILLENYPNPFNPSTTIKISIPLASFVTLKVFDIRGIELKRLISGHLNAGEHSYIWNAKDYSSGTYFVKLQTDTYSETHAMLLLK